MSRSTRVARVAGFAALLALIGVPNAFATTRVGLRGGLSIDPSQVLVGVHLQPPAVAKNLYVIPSADVGFGDDVFTLSFSGDLEYQFTGSDVRPYAGGGLALVFADPDNGDSDSDFGLNILGGLLFDRGKGAPLFFEAKAGLTDQIPNWKFMVGIYFR